MAILNLRYEALPDEVQNNLTPEQFELAIPDIVAEGETIPETTQYIDLASGVKLIHTRGERAPGNLLPTHDLSGARGKDDSQWQS
ncbi:MAG TPA: hypothetical protein VHS06_05770 [Chloroflexota bacterium]|nr:hypothetical protein [Chloroflexota bacterium]